jgi:hypothetical protein
VYIKVTRQGFNMSITRREFVRVSILAGIDIFLVGSSIQAMEGVKRLNGKVDQGLFGFEYRGIAKDPIRFIKDLSNRGINPLTIGPINGTFHAQYPSKLLPAHPNMHPEWISTAVNEAHAQKMKVIAWLPFNAQDIRPGDAENYQPAKLFPEWKMKFLWEPSDGRGPRVGMCVISSPFHDWYLKILQEVLTFGFDGIWFDGFYLGGAPHPLAPGCVCNYCKRRFNAETEYDLPSKIDWNDKVFKRWIRWRSEKLIETATFYTRFIKSKMPELNISFNCNTWPFPQKDWETAIPLWEFSEFGVSQHGYSNDAGKQWVILGYKSRLTHDMNPGSADIWRTSRIQKGNETEAGVARYELDLLLFFLAGLSYDVLPWTGGGIAKKSVYDEVRLRKGLTGGKLVEFAGILVSQDTDDFWGHTREGGKFTYRDSIIGTWMILTEQKVAFELIFDNQLDHLKKDLKVLILPMTAAISDQALAGIEGWVEQGGLLVVTKNTGAYDEWGEQPSGISRMRQLIKGLLKNTRESPDNGIPNNFLKSTLLGKGRIVAFGRDPGLRYARKRDQNDAALMMDQIKAVAAPFTVEGPPDLVINAYRHPERFKLAMHFLNVSSCMPEGDTGFRGIGRKGFRMAGTEYLGKKLNNIKVKVNEPFTSAILGVSGEKVMVERDGWFHLPEINLHEMLILK